MEGAEISSILLPYFNGNSPGALQGRKSKYSKSSLVGAFRLFRDRKMFGKLIV